MRRISVLMAAIVLAAFAADVSVRGQSPGQFKSLGVYAMTNTGIVKITTYGDDGDLSLHPIYSFSRGPLPKASSVSYFVLNMPEANAGSSELYWFATSGANVDLRKEKPLEADIEPIEGKIYKYSSASLKRGTGSACLRVAMPPGVADRLYCVALGAR